jgi:hypothetical protein
MEFTFEILEHDEVNNFFKVTYTPKDETLTPLTLAIGYPSIEVYTKEQLLDRIITNSPQGYWQQELRAREISTKELMATYSELVGHSEEIDSAKLASYDPVPENTLNAPTAEIEQLLQTLQQ